MYGTVLRGTLVADFMYKSSGHAQYVSHWDFTVLFKHYIEPNGVIV